MRFFAPVLFDCGHLVQQQKLQSRQALARVLLLRDLP